MTRFQRKASPVFIVKSLGAAAVGLLLAAAVISCKHQEPAHGPETSVAEAVKNAVGEVTATPGVSLRGDKSYAHVTYKPEVKVVEAAQADSSLQGISSDGNVFAFKNADSAILALKEGDALVIKNRLVRKVLATKTDGDMTYLLMDEAAITDVVQDADIQIDTPLSFNGAPATSELLPYGPSFMNIFGEPAYAEGTPILPCLRPDSAPADSAKAVLGTVVQGWTVKTWTVTPGSNELDFNLVITKSAQGFDAIVSMTGLVKNFNFFSNLGISQGVGKNVIAGVKNMTGKVQFNWEIGKSTPGVWAAEDRIKLPAGISIPLAQILGGMPLSLEISSALLIHPALTGGNELSKGGFVVTWEGGSNVSFQRGSAPSGNGQMNLTFQVTTDQNISPVAPNAMVISYCAPRLELKYSVFGDYANKLCKFASGITGIDNIAAVMKAALPASIKSALSSSPVTATNVLSSKADVYVQFITTEGVTHSANQTLAPCSKQEIKLVGQAGGEAQLFGLTKNAKTATDLFSKTYTRWDPASDFCKGV
jgi:hypothetical protein